MTVGRGSTSLSPPSSFTSCQMQHLARSHVLEGSGQPGSHTPRPRDGPPAGLPHPLVNCCRPASSYPDPGGGAPSPLFDLESRVHLGQGQEASEKEASTREEHQGQCDFQSPRGRSGSSAHDETPADAVPPSLMASATSLLDAWRAGERPNRRPVARDAKRAKRRIRGSTARSSMRGTPPGLKRRNILHPQESQPDTQAPPAVRQGHALRQKLSDDAAPARPPGPRAGPTPGPCWSPGPGGGSPRWRRRWPSMRRTAHMRRSEGGCRPHGMWRSEEESEGCGLTDPSWRTRRSGSSSARLVVKALSSA